MILLRALLVGAGGVVGVAARMLLGIAIPDVGGVPMSILIANVGGAFLIGILAARLGASNLRLFLATGMLGGFTTYSTYMVGTVQLWTQHPLLAAGYALLSLVLGLAAAALGLRLAAPRATHGRRP